MVEILIETGIGISLKYGLVTGLERIQQIRHGRILYGRGHVDNYIKVHGNAWYDFGVSPPEKYKSWVVWASCIYIVCVGFVIGLRFFFNDFSTPINIYLAAEGMELVIFGCLLYGLTKNSNVLAVAFVVLNVLLFFTGDHTSPFLVIQALLIMMRAQNIVAVILSILILVQLSKSKEHKTIIPTPVSTAGDIETEIRPRRVVGAMLGTIAAGFVSVIILYFFLALYAVTVLSINCASCSISHGFPLASGFLVFYIPLILFLSVAIPLWKKAIPFLARKLSHTIYIILFLIAIGALLVYGLSTV